MSTPVPVAKPASSGMAGLIALVVLLALAGAEYYLLTLRDEQRRHPTPVAAQLGAVKVPAPGSAKGRKGTPQQPAAAPPTVAAKPAPAPGQPVPLDLGAMLGNSAAGGGPGMLDQALDMADQLEAQYAGLGIRAVLVAACIGLLFMQKPPAPKVGAPRRRARNPKSIAPVMPYVYVVLGYAALALLGIGTATGDVLAIGYPAAAGVCLLAGFVGGQLRASTVPVEGPLMPEKVRQESESGVVLLSPGGRYVNVPNVFRGTLVLGGAGAGKTYSIGEPMLEQFLEKGWCGIVYDFKFPVLAEAVQKGLLYAQPAHKREMERYQKNLEKGEKSKNNLIEGLRKPIRHRVINFRDLARTEKVNPLRPQDMPSVAFAQEYAQTILLNLSPAGAKGGDNFFTKSAQAYYTAIIWYLRNNYPALCTVPHAVALALYKDFTHVLHMLSLDPSCETLVQSLITAVKQGAEKQIAGVVSSLQVDMSSLATPEISWVLSPDEDPRLGDEAEGFSLNLNDPENPTILTIGNDPTLAKTFAPVISCVVAVALKLMNQQRKHPSFVLIDEGATIYVPGLEVIPATARSNRVAMLYMTQDMAQLVDAYGRDKAQVLISNLNNQFIGKVNSAETAKLVNEMVGKIETEVVSVSVGQSTGSTGSSNKGQSISIQAKEMFRVQDAYTLEQGEFVGQTVETRKAFFWAQMERVVAPGSYPIAEFTYYRAERGVVDDHIREQVQVAIHRDTTQLGVQEAARVAGHQARATEWRGQRAQDKRTREQPARQAGRFRLASPAANTPDTQNTLSVPLTANTQNKPGASSTSNTLDTSNAGSTLNTGETSDAQNTHNVPAPVEWAWDEETGQQDSSSAEHWKPSPVEMQELLAEAARSRHARERVRLTPGAATPGSDESELSGEERERRAEAREKERTEQKTDRTPESTQAAIVAANHARIYREVETVIQNSGFNSLSKEGLARAAAEAKAQASLAQGDGF